MVLSGTKPLPKPIVTNFHDAIWYHKPHWGKDVGNQGWYWFNLFGILCALHKESWSTIKFNGVTIRYRIVKLWWYQNLLNFRNIWGWLLYHNSMSMRDISVHIFKTHNIIWFNSYDEIIVWQSLETSSTIKVMKGLVHLILVPVHLIMLWCNASYFTMRDKELDLHLTQLSYMLRETMIHQSYLGRFFSWHLPFSWCE